MLDADVDGYTKTLNHRKTLQNQKNNTLLKAKRILSVTRQLRRLISVHLIFKKHVHESQMPSGIRNMLDTVSLA